MDDGGELLGTPRLKNGLAYYPGVRTAQGIVLVGNVVQLNLLTPSGTPYVGFGHLKGVWLWRDQPYIRVQYLAPAAEKSGEEVTISDLLPQGSLGITATTDSTAAGSSSSASMALHGRKRGDDEAEEMELEQMVLAKPHAPARGEMPYPADDYLDSFVRPMYAFLQREIQARASSPIVDRVMYDDVNEFFWLQERFKAIMPPEDGYRGAGEDGVHTGDGDVASAAL